MSRSVLSPTMISREVLAHGMRAHGKLHRWIPGRVLQVFSGVMALGLGWGLSGCVISDLPMDSPTPTEDPDGSPTPTLPPSLPEDVTAVSESEDNGTISQANAVQLNQVIRGVLGPGDQDYYRLTIPTAFVGHKITLQFRDPGGDCFEGVDPFLDVLTSDGSTLLYHSEDSYENYCPRLSFAVSAGDELLLQLGTLWSIQSDYTLSILEGGPGTISGSLSLTADANAGGTHAVSGGPAHQKASFHATGGKSGNGLKALPARDIPIVAGELLVRPGPNERLAALVERIRQTLGVEVLETHPLMGGRYWRIKLEIPAGLAERAARAATRDLQARVAALPGVELVEVNRVFAPLGWASAKVPPTSLKQKPSQAPNDELLSSQWDLGGWPGMNLYAAWDLSTGSSDVIVAVGDTGHYPDHPDLVGKFVPGFDFVSDARSGGDGDGQDSNPLDILGQNHGSHVAGTIAANTDNQEGIAGLAWKTRYMPLRVCGDFGCTESDIADAIWYAAGYAVAGQPGLAEPRATAINLSLGGHDYCSAPLQDVIRGAESRGVVVVVAAGNSGDDATEYSPASCIGAIAVGSSDAAGTLSSFSNYGKVVPLVAPGEGIVSTVSGGYSAYNGTSMATPHIAGLVALMRALNPTLSRETLVELMQDAATRVNCGTGKTCGAGVPDAGKALAAVVALGDFDDVISPAYLVEARDVSDPGRTTSTFADGAQFQLFDVPAGEWRLFVGMDLDGDRHLSEAEVLLTGDGTIEISAMGEDITGVGL